MIEGPTAVAGVQAGATSSIGMPAADDHHELLRS